jgi:hypothetical protein
LIQLVNECEPLIEQNNIQQLNKYTSKSAFLKILHTLILGKITQIIRAFSAGMRFNVELIELRF